MSKPIPRPKVFCVPVAKPKPAELLLRKVFSIVHISKPVVAIISVVAVIIAVTSVQSPPPSKEVAQKASASEETVTFFSPSTLNVMESDQPFVISGKNAKIIGQITQISGKNQELRQIKAPAQVDNKTNRDLLSVVNKY